jgi:hypothetical protein
VRGAVALVDSTAELSVPGWLDHLDTVTLVRTLRRPWVSSRLGVRMLEPVVREFPRSVRPWPLW